MKTLKFRSNIKCAGCVNRVTPHLEQLKGISKWSVDLLVPEKILTVETDSLDPHQVIESVHKAGFVAHEIK